MTAQPMTLLELTDGMRRGETYLILDIRSRSEFQNWQIKGRSLQAVNIPFFDWRENEVNDKLAPERTRIVLLSLETEAAQKVATRFWEKGYEVSFLDGSLDVWLQLYTQATIMAGPRLKLIQFNRLATGCLSYLIVTGGECMVVDPSRHIDQYLEAAERENAKITHILDTHVHTDHVSGATALLESVKARYLIAHSEIHENDLPYTPLDRGTFRVGSLDVRVIILDTEGETRGNTLFVVDNRFLLSGDAIAVGEVAIPDLAGSAQEWAEKLFNTVLREVKIVSDDALVLPAHYADIQAVNAGGYVGAVLGDLRLGAEAMARAKVLTFSHHRSDFVSTVHANSEDIKAVNVGFRRVDDLSADELERTAREW